MNLLKSLTVGALAAALPCTASAALTVIHITGSTAFRAPTTCAIIHYCATSSTATVKAIYNGSGPLLKATSAIIANGTLGAGGTATVAFETNWTGSLAGCTDVATQNPLAFMDETNSTNQTNLNASATVTTSPFGGGSSVSSPATATSAPDACMSDSFASSAASALTTAQISGSITGGATTGSALAAQINAAGLEEAGSASPIVGSGTSSGYLGIVPFQWCIGNLSGATAPINITQQAASFLIKNGYIPMTMLSTSSSDTFSAGDFAYLVGRNEDSGTRIDAFAEPQLGFVQNPNQFLLTFSGGSNNTDIPTPTDFTQIGGTAALVETQNPWPATAALNTEPHINWASAGGGHGGYAGGGDVASVLSTPVDEANLSGSGFATVENTGSVYYIGYLGIADSGAFGNATKIPAGKALMYNGVIASTVGIQNGSYSFWSYEHMYYLPSVASAAKSALDPIANTIATTYASFDSGGASAPSTDAAGVVLSINGTVGNVKRTVEGGVYSLNY